MLHEDRAAHRVAGPGPLSRGAGDRAGDPLHRRRMGHLRPRQRGRPRRGAGHRRRPPADMARPQRAGHGPRRHRLRQGVEPAPRDGRDHLHRPRRHQPGDRRRHRAREPAPAPAAAGRRVREPRPRPGAPADRGLPGRHGERQRLLPAGEPILRPHHPPRAAPHRPAPRLRHDDRSGRMRAGHPLALPGRAGPGPRLAGALLRAPPPAPAPAAARHRGATYRAWRNPRRKKAPARRGRRRALRAGHGDVAGVRRSPRPAGGGDPGRQVRARLGPPPEPRPARGHRVERGQCGGGGGGSDHRRGHAPDGLHHRLVVAVRAPGAPHPASQRRGLRRGQARRHPPGLRRRGRA